MTEVRKFATHDGAQIRHARSLWPLLAELADSGEPERTYGEVAEELGTGPLGMSREYLSPIQSWCHEHHLPYLVALIVSKKTGAPGEGYRGDRSKRGHAKMVKQVRAYPWPKKCPF
jgi:hypothetical protein